MVSRREFLKISGLAVGGLALPSWAKEFFLKQNQFPQADRLGRICAGDEGAHFDLRAGPSWNSSTSGTVWRDDVIVWQREVVANQLDYNQFNQKWIETPDGYIYSPYVQPVKNILNQALSELPQTESGERGMWVEVSTPLVDIIPATPPSSYWIREALHPRVYYSQVFWAYEIRQENGKFEYRLKELYGADPDSYWVDASACRPITEEEIVPIHPEAEDKHIEIDLNHQTLSCYEDKREVYFCEISSGGIVDGEWLTPSGIHTIWRKMVSTHMSAGGLWGFDASGIGWTTLFDPHGAAIHASYWHNFFGTARSHGCINCRSEDAKWIWRWTQPVVNYYPGELTVQGLSQSTKVHIFD